MKNNQEPLQLLIEMFMTRITRRVLMFAISALAALFGILGPLFQKEFVDLLTQSPLILTEVFPSLQMAHLLHPVYFLIFSFFSVLFSLALNQTVNYLGTLESIHIQQLWSQRLYSKVLSLRSDTTAGRPTGEFVSIYATDIPSATFVLEQSIPQFAGIIFPMIMAPYTLIYIFKTPPWPTLMTMAAIVLLNFFLAYRQSRFFYLFKKLAADRIGLVAEWIQNIRTLRILGWTSSFEKKVLQVREVETANRIAMLNNGQTMNAISSSISFFINLAAISSLVYMSETKITPGAILALFWIVAVFLTRPFRMMPWFFTFIFDAWTSLKRLSSILSINNTEIHPRHLTFQKLKDLGAPDPALVINNLSLELGGKKILSNISFDVKNGEFLAIVGEVGSGKSVLLLSLLGETDASFEQYNLGANEAKSLNLDQLRQFYTFVPQAGFIMSASLRENVAFEYDLKQEFDEKILKSLERAQFSVQQERIPQGLDTEIGERGVNLSGGQKQRVSLARVDFFESPIVLLDDCVSAVDVDTEHKIIETLIDGSWKKRTRIFVTHRLSVLKKADRVLFLDQGQVSGFGTFSDLIQNNSSFADFVKTVERKATGATL